MPNLATIILLFTTRFHAIYRKDLKDLFARGDTDVPIPNALSRVLRPAMLGVFAQNPQMYTLGIVRLVMLMHFP